MTDTDFFDRAKMQDSMMVKEGKMADPADVARAAFKALMSGDDHVVTPIKSRIDGMIAKLAADSMAMQRAE
jgi:uncharacterized protein